MANFGQLILTNLGIQYQYKAQAGEPLKFKRIGMGSGTYSGNVMALTKLVKENVSVDISKGYMQNNAYTVEGVFSNEGLATGFAWREIGLFVEDESGNDVLYCYANAGDSYDFIPATGDERYSKHIRIATAISNASNISIVENEGIVFVDTVTFDKAVLELQTEADRLNDYKIATGSPVVCKDSANLPLMGLSIFGRSEQVKTEGYNLVGLPDVAETTNNGITYSIKDGVLTLHGTWDGTGILSIADVLGHLAEAGDYTLSIKPISGKWTAGSIGIRQVVGGVQTMYIQQSYSYKSATMRFSAEEINTSNPLKLYVTVGGKFSNFKCHLLLYKNEGFEKAYEPYSAGLPSPNMNFPQNIINVGDDGDVGVEVYGKNLCPMSDFNSMSSNGKSNTYDSSTHTITMNDDTALSNFTGRYCRPYSNKFKIGVKYTISFDIRGTAGKKVSCGWDTGRTEITLKNTYERYSSTKVATRVDEVVSFYSIATQDGGLASGEYLQFANVQIEVGEASEYVEYRPMQTLTVASPNGLAGIPVASGGNYKDTDGQEWVCDEIDFERGVYIQRITEKVIDGNSAIETDGADSNPWRKYVWINDAKRKAGCQGFCDKLINRTSVDLIKGNSINNAGFNISKDYNVIYFNIGYLMEEDTVEAAKAVLANNPLTVKYALETPIETALTPEQIAAYKALVSYNPSTTITNDADAGMKAQYITKTFEDVLKYLDGCRFRMVDGEKEWSNPPMEFDVEYRTSERWAGLPVYTKIVTFGNLPSSASTPKSVEHGIANIAHVLSVDLISTSHSTNLTHYKVVTDLYANDTKIQVETSGNLYTYNCVVLLKYVKHE